MEVDNVEEWTTDDVSNWLKHNGFDEYIYLFCSVHKMDGKALLITTENDLKQPPLGMKVLGDVKRLMIAIHQLQQRNPSSLSQLASSSVDGSVTFPNHRFQRSRRWRDRENYDSDSSDLNTMGSDGSWEDEQIETKSKKFKPELWKTVVALLYFLLVTWVTAIVMVIVHDQVPDMQTYPPLPDIFLDNVPLIPWAFSMCELTGIVLFVIWAAILIFHKHRFILLRRMFSLFGSVFLLRCITMIITSLSVPGRHLECKARHLGHWWDKIKTAFIIWQGGGMSIQGVRTCGDYMFSGHTVALTLLNFLITEYTPRRMYYLHTFTWVLNLFGIFFILAGHEHYSIDVFIAFYISTRLFLYYHTLANNRAIMMDDRRRTRIWFPLFYFFESGVKGIVPNEFEWPIEMLISLKSYIMKLYCSRKNTK